MAVRQRKGTDKWIADGRDAFGRRQQITFDTEREALDHEAEMRRARRTQRFTGFDPDTTLKAYAESWLSGLSVKPRSRVAYDGILRNHILPILGNLPMAEISRQRVRRFVGELHQSETANIRGRRKGRKEVRQERKLDRNTVRYVLRQLNSIIKAAVADGLLASNPLVDLGREIFGRMPRSHISKAKAMRPEQLSAFMDAARESAETYPVFVLLAMTGLRLGEVIALRFEDIDWQGSRIHVARQIAGKLKTLESEREVEVSSAMIEFLRDLERQSRELAFHSGSPQGGWILFPELPEHPTRRDEMRVTNRIQTDMKRVCRRAGLPGFSPHAFRHTYASRLISEGHPPEWVRRQLGHSKISTTMDLYGRWLPMVAPEGALNRLSEAVLGPGCNKSATGWDRKRVKS
jgi:integrase